MTVPNRFVLVGKLTLLKCLDFSGKEMNSLLWIGYSKSDSKTIPIANTLTKVGHIFVSLVSFLFNFISFWSFVCGPLNCVSLETWTHVRFYICRVFFNCFWTNLHSTCLYLFSHHRRKIFGDFWKKPKTRNSFQFENVVKKWWLNWCFLCMCQVATRSSDDNVSSMLLTDTDAIAEDANKRRAEKRIEEELPKMKFTSEVVN